MSTERKQEGWANRIVGLTYLPANQLHAHPKNPRRHPAVQRDALRGSLDSVGWAQAVLVNVRTNTLVDGHARIEEALSKDEDAEVPVLQIDVSEAEEAQLLATLDPMSALATYDREVLDSLLRDVETSDAALSRMLSDLAESNGLYFGEEKKEEDETEVAALVDRAAELQQKWQVSTGQIYSVGRHRLMCGDSANALDVLRLMDGEKASAVLTDPIYGQGQEGVTNDQPEGFEETVRGAVNALPIQDGVIVAFQSPRTFTVWLDAAREAGHRFERMLWMYKAAQCTFPWRGWILKSESILMFSKGNASWQDVHPYSHDCYYLPEVSGELDESIGWHGSVKPLKVVADILKRICPPDSIVFDGFSGSGTTMAACEAEDRQARCIDIDPLNCAVTLERMTMLGLTPELQGE